MLRFSFTLLCSVYLVFVLTLKRGPQCSPEPVWVWNVHKQPLNITSGHITSRVMASLLHHEWTRTGAERSAQRPPAVTSDAPSRCSHPHHHRANRFHAITTHSGNRLATSRFQLFGWGKSSAAIFARFLRPRCCGRDAAIFRLSLLCDVSVRSPVTSLPLCSQAVEISIQSLVGFLWYGLVRTWLLMMFEMWMSLHRGALYIHFT